VSVAVAPRERDTLGPAGDPAWARACAEAFSLDARLVEVPGASGCFALVRGRLQLVGPAELFEPGDVVFDGGAALAALVEQLAGTGRPLGLPRLPGDSPTIAAVRGRYPIVFERPAGACPLIRLDGGDPEASLPARRRSDLRRAARRAGAYEVEVHEPGEDETDALFDVAFAIEASSWKGAAGTALVHDPRRERFYRRYGSASAARGELRIALLLLGGEPASMQIAVERDGALWLLKIGYDERRSRASPGQLLLLETLRWAAARGLERYELLGQAASWTRAWTREERACSAVFAYPGNVRGAVALTVDALAHVRRRAVRR
jgi:hypothetical protein